MSLRSKCCEGRVRYGAYGPRKYCRECGRNCEVHEVSDIYDREPDAGDYLGLAAMVILVVSIIIYVFGGCK